MSQLSLFESLLWTVTQLTRYLRDILENDEYVQDISIRGEVSNLSRPASGHLYFTLKDNTSVLKCVMWRNAVMRQAQIPRDGEAVEVHGAINIYEAAGQYQLYADLIRPIGQGNLYQEFLRLKTQLETEGLFDEARKKPIPRWPHTIGVVTSPPVLLFVIFSILSNDASRWLKFSWPRRQCREKKLPLELSMP